MKKINKYVWVGACAVIALGSCSNEDILFKGNNVELVSYKVTTAIDVAEPSATRTVLSEVEKNLGWEWSENDVVVATSKSGEQRGFLVATSVDETDKTRATFEGSISIDKNLKSEELNFHYLGSIDTQNLSALGMTFPIDLSVQGGTLEDVASKDFLTSDNVITVTKAENYVHVPDFTLEHLTSAGHFRIELPNQEKVVLTTITGNNLHNYAAIDLGSRTLTDKGVKAETEGIQVAGDNFYVNLIPDENVTFTFNIVSDKGNNYTAKLCYKNQDGTLSEDPVTYTIPAGYYLRENLGDDSALLVKATGDVTYTLIFEHADNTEGTLPQALTQPGPATNEFTLPGPSNYADIQDKGDWKNLTEFAGWSTRKDLKINGEAEYQPGDKIKFGGDVKTMTLYPVVRQTHAAFYVDYYTNINLITHKETESYIPDPFWYYVEKPIDAAKDQVYSISIKMGYSYDPQNGSWYKKDQNPTYIYHDFTDYVCYAVDKSGSHIAAGEEAVLSSDNCFVGKYDDGFEYFRTSCIVCQKSKVWTLHLDANLAGGMTIDDGDLTSIDGTVQATESDVAKTPHIKVSFGLGDRKLSKTGLVFKGWATTKDATEPDVMTNEYGNWALWDDEIPTDNFDVTVYAVWETGSTAGSGTIMPGLDPTVRQ